MHDTAALVTGLRKGFALSHDPRPTMATPSARKYLQMKLRMMVVSTFKF
jgi:hypothetical protein